MVPLYRQHTPAQEIAYSQALIVDKDRVTAWRLKRAATIADKLRRMPQHNLSTMQNVARCRVTIGNVPHVYSVRDLLRNHLNLGPREDDYIQNPKEHGYRSLHLIHEPVVEGIKLRIEIQVRPNFQSASAERVVCLNTHRTPPDLLLSL
jgi:ppGpp synthetase/RelA/SpoT-type nucleotidyltranferase